MLGERLKEIRKRRQLSQEELGIRVGVKGQQIYRYESGENEPTADILAKIARELEVSSDYLLGLADDTTEIFAPEPLEPEEENLISAYRRKDYQAAMRIFADSLDRGKDGRRLRES